MECGVLFRKEMKMLTADVVKQNTVGNSEAKPAYVPSSFDWFNGRKVDAPVPPSGIAAVTYWGQLYPILGTAPPSQSASRMIEISNTASYVRRKTDKVWVKVQDQSKLGGAHYVGDFSRNASVPMTMTKQTDGSWRMPVPPASYNDHWWSDPRGGFADGSVDGFYCQMDLRVTGPAVTNLIANIGGDWWRTLTSPYVEPVSTNNPGIGMSNWIKLTEFRASLPPGVVDSVVTPPVPTGPTGLSVFVNNVSVTDIDFKIGDTVTIKVK